MPVSVTMVRDWVRVFATEVGKRKTELTELDSAIGDGDHGINMDRGMQAVVQKLDGGGDDDLGTVLRTVGMTLVSKVGGASGPLYGTFFLEAGKALGSASEASDRDWVAAVDAAVAGVLTRGKAEPGDKTMVDALLPARDALRAAIEAGKDLGAAAAEAATAAETGRDATVPLVARKGRASYLGERSAGHLDPGATSTALLFRCAADTFAG